jgi:hypothetical protein
MTFKPITKAEFYNIINDLDVCYNVTNRDYSIEMRGQFTLRSGKVIGKNTTNYDVDSDDYGKVSYEISEEFFTQINKIANVG